MNQIRGRVVVNSQTEIGGKVVTLATYLKLVQELGSDLFSVMSQDAATRLLQERLVSGQNIRTINHESILGSGNINIEGGTDWGDIGGSLSDQTDLKNALDGKAGSVHTHTISQIDDFPEIPAKTSDLENDSGFIDTSYHDDTKEDKIGDLAAIRTGANKGDTAVQPSDLSSVAVTGNYDDLEGKPPIPSAISELTDDSTHRTVTDSEKQSWNSKSEVFGTYSGNKWISLTIDGLAKDLPSGGSGEVNVIEDVKVNGVSLPVVSKSVDVQVPTATSDLNNDSGFIDSSYHDSTKVDKVEGKGLSENDYTTAEKTKLEGLQNYDDTAISGRVSAIEGKEGGWDAKQDAISDLSSIRSGANAGSTALQPSDVSLVATSGDYGDLSNKPTIPTVPTNVSAFNNDAGYLTQHQSLSAYRTASDQDAIDNGKVDKVTGKGLSTEDYTSAEKTKLSGIESGAEVNVQSDWNENDSTKDEYIKNKPAIPTNTSDLNNDSGFIDSTYHDATKEDAISDLSTIRSGAALGTTAVQPSDLAAVATSGDYSDLANTPAIPTKTSDLTNDSDFVDTNYHDATKEDAIADLSTIRSGAALGATAVQPADLAAVATSGSYNDLTDTPTIPTNTSDLNNDSGFVAASSLAAVATSGDYDDLTNKPTIPSVSGTNDGTNWQTITINGTTRNIPSGGGSSDHDFTFSTLASNTTAFTFAANQRCYQRVTMTAGATLTFSIANKADNYVRVYNSSASDITLAVGTITFNGTALSASSVVVPDDTISVKAGKYVEIGIVADENGAEITVSHKSKSNA